MVTRQCWIWLSFFQRMKELSCGEELRENRENHADYKILSMTVL